MTFVAPATASNPLLEIKNMSVDYYAANGTVHALTDVSITLERGTVLGLAGESGSGKSTLAYAITRLLRAPGIITGGQVLLHGCAGPAGEENAAAVGEPTALASTVDLLAADERQLRGLRCSRIAV